MSLSSDAPMNLMQPWREINSHQCIRDRLDQVFGIRGKDEQIEVLYRLMVEKKDTVLLAKTGFGKSILFQAPSMLSCGTVTIVLLPLLALQAEQQERLKSIGGRPFVLNGETNSKANREIIRVGQYTHILTSPEIAISVDFNRDILRDPGFSSRIALFAVDELHLVQQWGREFRPDYMNIAIIRKRMPANVPMLGVTATMNPKLLKEIVKSAGFNLDVSIISTPLDRPEIFIQVQPMLYSATSMQDLAFLVQGQSQNMLDYENIPKSIVFMESVAQIEKACRLLRGWISRLNYPALAGSWIQPFFSAMAQHDKDRIAEAFSKPQQDCKSVRILVSTDAYGLGIDNLDVVRIVQYDIPENLEVLYQRAGRAMRSGGQQAFFLMIVKPALIGDKSKVTDIDLSQAEQKRVQQRANLSTGLYNLINATRCLRSIILESFDAIDARPATRSTPALCCSFCNPDKGLVVHYDGTGCDVLAGSVAKIVENQLRDWRKARASTVLQGRFKHYDTALLMDKSLATIVRHSPSIDRVKELRAFVGFGWAGHGKYSHEILDVLRSSNTIVTEALEEKKRKQEELSQKVREEARKRVQEHTRNAQEYTKRLQGYTQSTNESSQRSADVIQKALESLECSREILQATKENLPPASSQDKPEGISGSISQNSRKRKSREIPQDHRQPLAPVVRSRNGRIIKPSAKMLQ